eukprot:2427701-Alexandrium_andersonii.AAC.1
MARGSQYMGLSDLWMSSSAQLFRAMKETCTQFGARRLLVLFGPPDTSHRAYLSAFNAVLPDVCMVTNRTAAEVLICAKPSCNIWHEQHITSVLGIWG